VSVAVYRTKHEGVYHIDAALKDYGISATAVGSQVYESILKSGQENIEKDAAVDVVVAASGNFGMIYFPAFAQRAGMEEMEAKYPGLLQGLVEHPGIGFIVAKSGLRGPVAMGKKGKLYLSSGEVEGQDPLGDYAPLTLHQLARGDSFPDTPDIMVMSTYWKDEDEAAAFEELVGSHGGAGGEQSRPFILYPSEFDMGTQKISGAEAVYRGNPAGRLIGPPIPSKCQFDLHSGRSGFGNRLAFSHLHEAEDYQHDAEQHQVEGDHPHQGQGTRHRVGKKDAPHDDGKYAADQYPSLTGQRLPLADGIDDLEYACDQRPECDEI
jgi:hypothetical protein